MKKFHPYGLAGALVMLLCLETTAQCTGGRYHDLVFPGSPTVTSDVVYGSNLDQNGATVQLKLDVYEPACDVATNRPLVIFAHGGSFVTGDKADAGYVQTAVALAQLGYVVASINYRLGFPTTGLAAQYGFNSAIMRGLHDGRAAVRFMRNNALNGGNTWKIDPTNIFFGGVSAGGIIALHLAYQNTSGEMTMNCGGQPGTDQSSVEGNSNNLNVSSAVKAIISISGGIRDLNWITNNDIPVCMAHGTNDGTVPYGSGSFGGFFPVYGSSSIATRCSTTNTKYCFKPMINQDHTPSNPAYVDTVAVLMRNFLEHFVCNVSLNCNYTGSPTATTPSVSIALTSGTNPTCAGASVTFTATATNPGANPVYTWKKNGQTVGTNSTTYTTNSLANNDVITCVLTSCATTGVTSNAITMTVNAASAPAVSIALTSGSNPTCAGASLTFTATPTNGGNAPSYQWKKNGSNVGTNSSAFTSTTLVNGDVISCVMTSNSSCANPTTATSNSITISVSSTVAAGVSIAITSGTNPSCADSSVTFTATPSNGGTAPAYQWKKNGNNIGTNNGTFTTTTLANNDVITCVLTSNLGCANPNTATSTPVTITIHTPPTITQTGNVLTASSSASYQWYRNGQLINGATSQIYTATQSGSYTVTGGNNCHSQAKNVVISGLDDNNSLLSPLFVYPNPSTGSFTVQFNAEAGSSFVLQLKDVTGRTVHVETITGFSGAYEKTVAVDFLAKGTYTVHVTDGNEQAVRRVVVY
ncbi:MAG: alpha/beta hydrolase fold domain-containing protein [Chitinophagales bacterium]|nr:alpha/beta hydrolase fold domain-containing protein [Chitinophagales bacterium]